MPYPAEHMLFQWTGLFAQTGGEVVDEFVGSMRFYGPDLGLVDNDDVGEALWSQLKTFWTDSGNFISSFAKLGYGKWNRIGPDGRYVSGDQTRIITTGENLGGASSPGYPLQVAWATTWLTDHERGRASRGRTYWPTAVPVVAGDNLRVQAGRCQTLAANSLALIQAWNSTMATAGAATCRAVIASNIGSGNFGYVNAAKVGNRLDIQRRRDNKLPEAYYSTRA